MTGSQVRGARTFSDGQLLGGRCATGSDNFPPPGSSTGVRGAGCGVLPTPPQVPGHHTPYTQSGRAQDPGRGTGIRAESGIFVKMDRSRNHRHGGAEPSPRHPPCSSGPLLLGWAPTPRFPTRLGLLTRGQAAPTPLAAHCSPPLSQLPPGDVRGNTRPQAPSAPTLLC